MNKKIKVIELLNRTHENKDIPQRIKLDGVKYEWDDKDKVYRDEGNNSIGDNLVLDKWLEDEVEILANKANKEDEEEIDIETKLFEEIEMCLKRLSDKDLTAKPYVDRYEYALKKYKDKKINKED